MFRYMTTGTRNATAPDTTPNPSERVVVTDYTYQGKNYIGQRGISLSVGKKVDWIDPETGDTTHGDNGYSLYVSPREAEELGTALLYVAKLARGEISG